MRSQIYKDLTISLPSFPPLSSPPRYSPIFFRPPSFRILVCASHAWAFHPLFLFFSVAIFSRVSCSFSLFASLLFSLSPFSLSLSLLCRVISGNGAAAMFCLPGAGLLQAWRVPCLRSGFRDYPPPPLLPASLLFSSEATCNFSPNTYIQTPFRSCHGWGT